MKTLIIYTSKHGSTKKVSHIIKDHYKDCDVINISKETISHLETYDLIYIGSPIYYGSIHKKIARFLKKHKATLLEKKVKLFTLGMDDKNIHNTIKKNFDKKLLDHASHCHLGGAYQFEDMSFLERFIVKKVATFSESVDTVDQDKLQSFIDL